METDTESTKQIIFHLNHFCDIPYLTSANENEYKDEYKDDNKKRCRLLSNYNFIDKVQVINNKPYHLLKYDKNYLTDDSYSTFGKFRSIIYRNGKILSYSPPKAMKLDDFKEKFNVTECYAEEFIEGTMINVFYDKENENWEIATKSSVGARVRFFNNAPTFADMFYETCTYHNMEFKNLDKTYTYTFIMQHPNNRIVMPILYPTLYLIRVYKIDGFNIHEIAMNEINSSNVGNYLSTCNIHLPIKYPITSFDDIEKYFASMNTPYYYPGIMIYHTSGERAKIRNPTYEDVRMLRGNQTKLQYQYLWLRKEGKVRDYLIYYPENKHVFSIYRELVHRYTNNLYSNYVDCYIKKMKPLKEFPHEYKVNMFKLHKLYLDELREANEYINRYRVMEFVNKIEPAYLMHVLNYHNFQQYKDTMNIEKIND